MVSWGWWVVKKMSCQHDLLPNWAQIASLAVAVALTAILVAVTTAWVLPRVPLHGGLDTPFTHTSGKAVVVPPLPENKKYHCFISHTWKSGQDQANMLKARLRRHLPGLAVFLDVDDLEDTNAIPTYVEASVVFLAFVSDGYFQSNACLNELRAACKLERPLLLVYEISPIHGGMLPEQALSDCPQELSQYVHGAQSIILWHRHKDLQACALIRISENVLDATLHVSKTRKRSLDMQAIADGLLRAKQLQSSNQAPSKSSFF